MSNELPMLLNKLELEKQTKEEEDKFTKSPFRIFLEIVFVNIFIIIKT